MKYRDTYRIVTQVSRYVSHRDFRYRVTPSFYPFGTEAATVIVDRTVYQVMFFGVVRNIVAPRSDQLSTLIPFNPLSIWSTRTIRVYTIYIRIFWSKPQQSLQDIEHGPHTLSPES